MSRREDGLGQDRTVDGTLAEVGFEQLTVAAVAIGLTVPAGARLAQIQNQGTAALASAHVRWRSDGGVPTAAVGMRLLTNGELIFNGTLSAIQFIRESALSAILNVTYYR